MIVYLARNRANGKGYVGKTGRTLRQRRKEHRDDALVRGSDMPFHRAIRLYGPEAFEWIVLSRGGSENELNELERHHIQEQDAFRSGYNCTQGGDGMLGWKHSEETRRRMSEARRGEGNPNWGGISDEHKRNIAKSKVGTGTGPRPHMRGRRRSEETRRKISLGSMRRKDPISVRQLSTDGEFIAMYPSLSKAAQAVGGTGPGIKRCCEGQSTYRGYVWCYVTQEEKGQ